ncbi:MAG TPA: ROK family protein [Streptosporangiaceae bacterium]|jgi:glucokinase|nr:ROK family protein [Streptosporangiaceae bacterium]
MFSGLSLEAIDRQAGDAAIGIDVGGTKVALGLLDAAELSLLESVVIPTGRDRGGKAVLADIRAAAGQLAGRAANMGRRVSGIGLVVPEIVSVAGEIVSGVVIPQWDELPVAGVLSEIAPVRVEADVRAAAFAETVLGAGQGYDYLVFVTVGTGISYTAVYQGRPIAGSRGGALNIGTTVLARLPEHCATHGEPREIVLERIASGSALVERYVARGGTAEGAADVLAAARQGDRAAGKVLDEGARTLGLAIALLVNVLDPEAVIVGGGLGSADTPYWQATQDYTRQYLHNFAAGTVLARGALGADAGVIGAGLTGLCS